MRPRLFAGMDTAKVRAFITVQTAHRLRYIGASNLSLGLYLAYKAAMPRLLECENFLQNLYESTRLPTAPCPTCGRRCEMDEFERYAAAASPSNPLGLISCMYCPDDKATQARNEAMRPQMWTPPLPEQPGTFGFTKAVYELTEPVDCSLALRRVPDFKLRETIRELASIAVTQPFRQRCVDAFLEWATVRERVDALTGMILDIGRGSIYRFPMMRLVANPKAVVDWNERERQRLAAGDGTADEPADNEPGEGSAPADEVPDWLQ